MAETSEPRACANRPQRQHRTALGRWSLLLACTAWLHANPALSTCTDNDHDSLDDVEEERLAQQFAPVIYHAPDEPNLPTNVGPFLAATRLHVYDTTCSPPVDKLVASGPTRVELLNQIIKPCVWNDPLDSRHAWDRERMRTYYLEDLDADARAGSSDSRAWTTYFHAYPNDVGGVTIQYWRFYAFNSGVGFGLGAHGGDWEAIHVVLDHKLQPKKVRLLGHQSIAELDWKKIEPDANDNHPVIYSEWGGHASRDTGSKDGVRQETWTTPQRGKVTGPGRGQHEVTGELVNLGEKLYPMRDAEFLRYAGLWGSPGIFVSGYWGPAFNETDMDADSFVRAWCEGRWDKLQQSEDKLEFECFPRPPTPEAERRHRPQSSATRYKSKGCR